MRTVSALLGKGDFFFAIVVFLMGMVLVLAGLDEGWNVDTFAMISMGGMVVAIGVLMGAVMVSDVRDRRNQ